MNLQPLWVVHGTLAFGSACVWGHAESAIVLLGATVLSPNAEGPRVLEVDMLVNVPDDTHFVVTLLWEGGVVYQELWSPVAWLRGSVGRRVCHITRGHWVHLRVRRGVASTGRALAKRRAIRVGDGR